MSKKKKVLVRTISSLAMAAVVIPAYLIGDGYLLRWLFYPLSLLVMFEMATIAEEEADPFGRIDGTSWIGFSFIVLVAADCYLANDLKIPREFIGFAMAVTVTTDIGAYCVGNLIGGKVYHERPFPDISPNKTWEGTLGGIMIGMVSNLLWTKVFHLDNISANFALICFFLPILATCGDLAESAFKRACHVKDSNDRMPKIFAPLEAILGGRNGHGGYFDRLDSLIPVLFVVIFAYIWVR